MGQGDCTAADLWSRVHELAGPYGGTEYYYTIDAGLRDHHISHYGFISEGIAAYVYGYPEANTTPLYELSR